MKVIDIDSLTPPGAEVAIFQGLEHGAKVSFFVVQFSPGKGPRKHRHPYEETFLLLAGELEFVIDGQTHTLGSGKIAIVPAGAWHEFKNRSDRPASMVNVHPVPKMITEWA